MAQKVCLGVELSPDGLNVALVEPERRNIIKIDVIPTSGNSMEDASIYTSTISSWVRSNLSLVIYSTAMALPAYNGIIRLVAIPKEIPKENVPGYVEWELASAINSKSSDYLSDFFYYPNEKKPERAVVRAWRRKSIDALDSAEVKRSGFGPAEKEMDIIALLNLLEISEGLDSRPKCILKADEKFAVALWGNEAGPLAIMLLPKNCISPSAVLDILQNGYEEVPKTKRKVKFCGELSINSEFTEELVNSASNLSEPIEVEPWYSLPKFSFNKGEDFSKLSQCLGAIAVTFSL